MAVVEDIHVDDLTGEVGPFVWVSLHLTITVPAGFAAGSYGYSINATSAEGIQASGQSLIVTQ